MLTPEVDEAIVTLVKYVKEVGSLEFVFRDEQENPVFVVIATDQQERMAELCL